VEKRINRIDLADYRDLEQILGGILKLIPDLEPPVPVEALAADLDISEIKDMDVDGFVGAIITDRERSDGVILVKKELREQRRRFTIGHELGHFLCPTHIPPKGNSFYCTGADMGTYYAKKSNIAALMEVQANNFSANLLMPTKLVRLRIPSKADPHLQHVLDLCKTFNTSKEMTARRYVDVQSLPCALVVSKDGKVRYPLRHEDFPYLPSLTGKPLPPKSLSANVAFQPGYLSDPVGIAPLTWLADNQARRADYLSEQVLVQQDGYRLTLLTAVLKDEEEEDEDKELRESWTPRFHR